jgi:hypothetical protein
VTAREQLDAYIEKLKRRLRLRALLLGTAILALSALFTTVVLVLITNALAFSGASVTGARAILVLVLACGVAFGCVFPLLRLNRRRAAWQTEAAFPRFQQRLITLAERGSGDHEPFAELLAADTLAVVGETQLALVVPNKKLLASVGVALSSLGVLIWMILAGPGYLGYGSALLWTGDAGAAPLYDIRVSPGDVTVRRNADQLVIVQPRGIQINGVRIYARYESTSKWEQLSMQPQPGASGFQFLFAGLPEGVEYYVEAGPLHSRHFNIRVTDMPSVKQIRVTYHFPSWTGMQPVTEDHGGDLHAIEGTEANIEITTDRALSNGVLVLDDDRQISLSHAAGNLYKGVVRIDKDGTYHVAALDRDQPVRISEDFFIEASKANPPEVVISRPGGDYHASPIEEVTVSVKADDQFGLSDFDLHYSVNGGAEQTVSLLKQKGDKAAEGSTTISLENFKVVPGDIVSVYATAKDAHAESRTDMFFIQAEPFEREYSQSQQMGGGGGGGGNAPDEISQRQKEIIGATWKQLGDKNGSAQSPAENAKFLSGVQSKLRDQAISLAGRIQMRGLIAQNDEFTGFQNDMNAAAQAMGPASQKLQQQKWKDAIPEEQKALQYLLRAEATFRQIEVAFGNAGSANGGGAGTAGRDLASLFDLELDTQKNQYETAQTAESGSQRAEQIDEALRKLDELARRQDELASQSNNGQTPEQRWQQEMLRRDAEQLQRQIEQLSRNSQAANASGGQSSGQSQTGQGGSASDPRIQQALNQLRQANEDMRRASSQPQNQADARRAAQRLRDATSLLGGAQRQQQSGRLDALAGEADRLANEQRNQTDRIHAVSRGQGSTEGAGNDSPQTLADDRQRLADDLSNVEKKMRDAVRDLSSNDRAAASKLRDALRELDQSDLDTRMQRSADWLRRGVNPDRNGSESQIGSDLQQLSRQVREAQQAIGGGENRGNSQSALDRVESLRNRLEALDRSLGGRNASGGRQSGTTEANANGATGNFVNGGGAQYGPVYGGVNTGNNLGQLPEPSAPDTSPVPPERAYRESVTELDNLRQAVKDDPETLRQVQELIREMQRLDPSRFPGNPAIVEELHSQVLSDIDKLELQLRRDLDGKQSGQVRNSESLPMPPGYEDAIAEYFRRLSKGP